MVSLVICGLSLAIWLLLFSDLFKGPAVVSDKIDPYVLSTKGKTLIFRDKIRTTVEEDKQELIRVGDKIRTLDSTATVFWPDGSITRLSEKSSIKINEMRAKTASEQIQIDFSLENGKSWSYIVKYMFGDSYFHERFNNDKLIAAVRWTIFEINLDDKYIHAINHGISIENTQLHDKPLFIESGWILTSDTQRPLSVGQFDIVWNSLNHDADVAYLKKRTELFEKQVALQWKKENYGGILKTSLRESSSSASVDIAQNERALKLLEERIYKEKNPKQKQLSLLNLYQSIYVIENTTVIVELKIRLRDAIIKASSPEEKKAFLNDFARSTYYEMTEKKANKVIFTQLQWKLEEYISQWADNIVTSGSKEWGV